MGFSFPALYSLSTMALWTGGFRADFGPENKARFPGCVTGGAVPIQVSRSHKSSRHEVLLTLLCWPGELKLQLLSATCPVGAPELQRQALNSGWVLDVMGAPSRQPPCLAHTPSGRR